MMKWTYVYWALGASFLAKLWEKVNLGKIMREAQILKTQTKKPLLLVSDNHYIRSIGGFDVAINSQQTPWKLPYPDKAFAAVVSDALEHIPYPQQAIAEWQRVADTVLINTHAFWSLETWLDLRHNHAFIGNTIIAVNPVFNWTILGGVGYWLYKRRSTQRVITEETAEEAPEETEEPPIEELPVMAGAPKIETAPLVIPETLPKSQRKVVPPEKKKEAERAQKQGAQLSDIPFIYQDLNGHRGINLNLSGGAKADMKAITQYLKSKGIENLAFDPVRYSGSHNQRIINRLQKKPANSATLDHLFSTPPWSQNQNERLGALQLAYENVKRGGKIYIDELNARQWLPEVKQLFPDAKIQNGIITAIRS